MSNWIRTEESCSPPEIQKKNAGRKKKVTGAGGLKSALCRFWGTVMLVAVIAVCLPLTLPKLLGCSVYIVKSGSMEPDIRMGSYILAVPTDPAGIKAQDVISFREDDVVVTHRVIENKVLEGVFITKGDANKERDREPVQYRNFIGKEVMHSAVLGQMMYIFSTSIGKLYGFIFAMCGVMLHMLAGRLKSLES